MTFISVCLSFEVPCKTDLTTRMCLPFDGKTRVVFNNPRVFITASVERKWRMMEEEVIPKAAQGMESDQSVSHTDDTPLLVIFFGGGLPKQ